MSAALMLAVAAIAAGLAAAGEWFLLRGTHRKSLATLRSHHREQQLNLSRKLEQAKRQVAQLQQELSAARLESKQRRERSQAAHLPSEAALARQSLGRQLDEAPQRPRMPAHGFADTLPAPSFGPHGGLLMR
jgi:hypothetical protein